MNKSEARERTIKRTLITLTILVFLAGLGAAYFGYYNYRNAVVAEARSLWPSLPADRSLSEGAGADGLLAVARSTPAVREQFILQILNNPNIAADFSANPGLIMNAVAGINAGQRENIASALQAALKPELPDEIHVARTLALLELNLASPEILIEAIGKTTDSDQLNALGQSLAAVAGKLGDTQAAAVVTKFVEAIQKSTDSYQLYALGQGLAAAAGKLGDTQAAAVVPLLLEAIQKSTDSYQLDALGQGLAAVAGKLGDTQAAAVVPLLLEAIQKSTDSDQLKALGQGLAAVAGKLGDTQAAAVVSSMLKPSRRAPTPINLTHWARVWRRSRASSATPRRRPWSRSYVEAIREGRTDYAHQLELWARVWRRSRASSATPRRRPWFRSMLKPSRRAPTPLNLTHWARVWRRSRASSATPRRRPWSTKLLEAIQKSTDSDQLEALGQGLAAVAGKLGDTQAAAVVQITGSHPEEHRLLST